MTCKRTQEFLAKEGLEPATQVNARKNPIGERDALELARQVDVIYVSKGKRVVRLDMKNDPPDKATLAGLIVGPTGNLRAPTLRKGRTLLVGFEPQTWKEALAEDGGRRTEGGGKTKRGEG